MAKKNKSSKKKKAVTPNRQSRATVFEDLFSTAENLNDLVASLNPAGEGQDVLDMTIHRIFTEGEHNDMAILVRSIALVLVEHQTRYVENLPFRMLKYLGRVVEIYGHEEGLDKQQYTNQKIVMPPIKLIAVCPMRRKTASWICMSMPKMRKPVMSE